MSSNTQLFLYVYFHHEIKNNYHAESDTVNTEETEIMILHKAHKEVDDNNGDGEGDRYADEKQQKLKRRRCEACQNKL